MKQPSAKLLKDVFSFLQQLYDDRGDITPIRKDQIDNIIINLATAEKYISEKIADEEVRKIEEREKTE